MDPVARDHRRPTLPPNVAPPSSQARPKTKAPHAPRSHSQLPTSGRKLKPIQSSRLRGSRVRRAPIEVDEIEIPRDRKREEMSPPQHRTTQPSVLTLRCACPVRNHRLDSQQLI